MARALLLEGPRSLRLQDEPEPELGRRAIRVKALVSGISHGTELSLYRGTSAFDERVFDRDLRVFVRPDPPRPTYPATLGYELVGTVERDRRRCRRARAPGTSSTSGAPHRDEAILDLDAAAASTYPPVRLPGDAPLERWLFVSVGAVALVAAHDARIKLGDHVAVIGLGAIGLLLVQMARLAGARRVSVVDPVAERRELALALGADEAIDPREAPDGAGAAIKRSAGRGVDVAVETSGTHRGPARRGRRARTRRDRGHGRLLPGRRARAAPRRGVAPQPARAGLEHGRVGLAASRLSRVGPPARDAHGRGPARVRRGARGQLARPPLRVRGRRRRLRLARRASQ